MMNDHVLISGRVNHTPFLEIMDNVRPLFKNLLNSYRTRLMFPEFRVSFFSSCPLYISIGGSDLG